MNYNEFIKALEAELNKREIKYSYDHIYKNGNKFDVLILQLEVDIEKVNANPVLYLGITYDKYCKGRSISELLDAFEDDYSNQKAGVMQATRLMENFNTAAPYLYCKVVNKDRYKEYVVRKGCIHKEFLDLYIIPIAKYQDYCTEIPKRMTQYWKVTEKQILDTAIKNIQDEQYLFSNFSEFLGGIKNVKCDVPMYILTNQDIVYGAGKILSPKILKTIEKTLDGKYWIIPSSVHECIIIPLSNEVNAREIKELIKFVNMTEVSEEDYLSDSLYEYTGKEIIIVDEEGGC